MSLPTRFRLPPAAVVLLAAAWICPTPAEAGVVVLGNRTNTEIDFALIQSDGKTTRHRLEARGAVPIPAVEAVRIAYDSAGRAHPLALQPSSIYYFIDPNGKLQLGKVALPPVVPEGKMPAPPKSNEPIPPVYTVEVMLLVDEDEPAVQRLWERRLRDRLAEASKIFLQHCRVRFEVVAIGTWQSNDRTADFSQSLREFELEVDPAPAQLAIGFTSQYKRPSRQKVHLGGTRGAMHPHILIREWAQHVSQTERLEILVHELGHYLGATHSREGDSVMRPKLGDHRSHARGFRIGFDPLNTFIMYLLCEELRAGKYRGLSRLHPHVKAHLRSAYTAMGKLMPDDESTKNYLKLLDRSPYYRVVQHRHPRSLIDATAVVVRAIGDAARRNHAWASAEGQPAGAKSSLSGDRLTEYYVRWAAAAAAGLPSNLAPKAFLLGLGIALDDSSALNRVPLAAELCRRIESSRQRAERLAALGSPTMRGRADLTKHFAISCTLTAVLGRQLAESVGIAKEMRDARSAAGFSFVDLSADLAGSEFATHVQQGKIPLSTLANSFAVADFLPEAGDLEEGISWDDFRQRFHSIGNDAFVRQQTAIRSRILALPVYRTRQPRVADGDNSGER